LNKARTIETPELAKQAKFAKQTVYLSKSIEEFLPMSNPLETT
jgi:hypothetical protein